MMGKIGMILHWIVLIWVCETGLLIQANEQEINALLSLKSQIIDTQGSLNSWVSPYYDSPPYYYCTWVGVHCSNHGTVVSLNLAGKNLSGSIPPVVGRLRSLLNLSLAHNRFSGRLPGEISLILGLRFLNISRNSFNHSLPASLSNLTLLQVLDCYNNNFTGQLPVELSRLANLKWLHLGGNYFEGTIPPQYGNLQNLTYLAVSGNCLTGKLPPQLGSLGQLEQLYLGYFNNFNGGIPFELGRLSNLLLLDMSSCNLSGNLPVSLGSLSKLESLFLQSNQIVGSIPAEFGNLTSLQSLDISSNYLTGYMPEDFKQLQKLQLFNVFMNGIEGNIPSFVGFLPELRVLQLWQNNISGVLPQELGNNGQFITLDLSFNSFSGKIPPNLCRGGKLRSLILMNNLLTGNIPVDLGNCPSLDRLRLGQNRLTGIIPPSLFSLPRITILEIPQNLLAGGLPTFLPAASPFLRELDLSFNLLSGIFTPALGNLSSLQTLLLPGNKLKGEIPAQIGLFKFLTRLDLSSNRLTGSIPHRIGSCQYLTILDLSQNQLTGQIPPQVADLAVLGYLNLSRNWLSGSIPSSLQVMQSLIVLDFSFNNLSGGIPEGGLFANYNSSAFEGNPRLCGGRFLFPCKVAKVGRSSPNIMSNLTYVAELVLAGIFIFPLLYFGCTTLLLRSVGGATVENSAWVLTPYYNLGFQVDHVLACLVEENIIGKGFAGTVYRGVMPDGHMIAVKKLLAVQLNKGDGDAGADFPYDSGIAAEIKTLGKIRHRHIVRLLGFCSNGETNLLVYEYMGNGSLGQLLHGPRAWLLDWPIRYKVALEAAKGLSYLHHDAVPPILHRDVKSNNILLDSRLEAHVADFGLAKFLGEADCVSTVAGSFGYIAPEYTYTLKVDEKSDIYSFGIVLLELLTGRRPIELVYGENEDIRHWVMSKMQSKAGTRHILDSKLLPPYPSHSCSQSNNSSWDKEEEDEENVMQMQEMMLVLRVALLCVDDSPSKRPSMWEVVKMLSDPNYLPRSSCTLHTKGFHLAPLRND